MGGRVLPIESDLLSGLSAQWVSDGLTRTPGIAVARASECIALIDGEPRIVSDDEPSITAAAVVVADSATSRIANSQPGMWTLSAATVNADESQPLDRDTGESNLATINGDWSDGTTGWVVGNAVEVSDGVARITYVGPGDYNAYRPQGVSVGRYYLARARVRGDGTGKARVSLGTSLPYVKDTVTATEWEIVSVMAAANSSARPLVQMIPVSPIGAYCFCDWLEYWSVENCWCRIAETDTTAEHKASTVAPHYAWTDAVHTLSVLARSVSGRGLRVAVTGTSTTETTDLTLTDEWQRFDVPVNVEHCGWSSGDLAIALTCTNSAGETSYLGVTDSGVDIACVNFVQGGPRPLTASQGAGATNAPDVVTVEDPEMINDLASTTAGQKFELRFRTPAYPSQYSYLYLAHCYSSGSNTWAVYYRPSTKTVTLAYLNSASAARSADALTGVSLAGGTEYTLRLSVNADANALRVELWGGELVEDSGYLVQAQGISLLAASAGALYLGGHSSGGQSGIEILEVRS